MSLKSVRKAVRTFLGVKKKTNDSVSHHPPTSNSNLRDNRRRFGSETALGERRDQRSLPRRSNSSVEGVRSSTLPRATRERIEEWNRNACPDDASSQEEFMRRTISGSSRRSGSRLRSSQSMSSFDTRQRKPHRDSRFQDDILTSRRRSNRDLGSINLYRNEGITESGLVEPTSPNERFTASVSSRDDIRRDMSKTLPARGSSFSMPRSNDARSRTISHSSMASERLVNCMEKLEKMSRQLNEATMVSQQTEKLSRIPEQLEQTSIARSKSQERLNSVDSKKPHRTESKREILSNIKTVDDGRDQENINLSNKINPPSRPKSSSTLPRRRVPADWNVEVERKPRLMDKQHHLRSDSLSSGYSSASGSPNSRNRSSQEEDERSISMCSYASHGYPQEQQLRHHEPIYQDEGIYGYGSYGYPSSSIYEDELQQHNGWFYLPSHQTNNSYPYYPQSQQYHQMPHYPIQYPSMQYTGGEAVNMCDQSYLMPQYPTNYNQQWGPQKYGGLTDSFLDPTVAETPLAAAISSTRVPSQDFGSCESPDSSRSDWKKYGSFRYRNGEKTILSGDSRRRKTVRFSQTVKQRIETDASEMEDSTSIMKGSHEDEEEKQYDAPSAWRASPADPKPGCRNSLSEPIYEFPSGHIENSCMCSDCILARQSCQLQPAMTYAYY